MFELSFSKKIDDDIQSVMKYIKNKLHAPLAAETHLKELDKVTVKLKENPYRRPLVQDKYLALKGYRSVNVKNFTLFYKIHEESNTVLLHRFMYSQRDWISILSEDDEF